MHWACADHALPCVWIGAAAAAAAAAACAPLEVQHLQTRQPGCTGPDGRQSPREAAVDERQDAE